MLGVLPEIAAAMLPQWNTADSDLHRGYVFSPTTFILLIEIVDSLDPCAVLHNYCTATRAAKNSWLLKL
jgi:hypothetical protein